MVEEIVLSYWPPVSVDPRSRPGERAELLVRSAQSVALGRRHPGYVSETCGITREGIESLIGAGARVIKLNRKISGEERYFTKVRYRNHTFTHSSAAPISYQI